MIKTLTRYDDGIYRVTYGWSDNHQGKQELILQKLQNFAKLTQKFGVDIRVIPPDERLDYAIIIIESKRLFTLRPILFIVKSWMTGADEIYSRHIRKLNELYKKENKIVNKLRKLAEV